MTEKQIYQIGLTMINGVGDILARHLLQTLGEAEAVFAEKQQLLERIPGIGSVLAAEIKRPEVYNGRKKRRSLSKRTIFPATSWPIELSGSPQGMSGRSRPLLF